MNSKIRKERFIIVGGNAAGMSAASKAKRLNPKLEVLVFERSSHVSYSACGIPYYISDMVHDVNELVTITPEEFHSKRDVTVLTKYEVVDIKPVKRLVTVIDLNSGKDVEYAYDKLLIATGSSVIPPFPVAPNVTRVFSLQTLDDGIRVKKFIDEKRPKSIAIVGGGYIAMEMAEALSQRNINVLIIEKSGQILPGFGPEIVKEVASKLNQNKVEVLTNSQVEKAFCSGHDSVVSQLESGEKKEADMMLVCTGIQPNSKIAQLAGARLNAHNAIAVDWKMQTTVSNIFAAGDCAETQNIVSGKKDFLPSGPTANKQGRIAGENIGGGTATFPGVTGTSVFKLFDLEVARTGLDLQKAQRLNFDAMTSSVTVKSKAGYYSDATPITISVVFNKRDGRLLGAQMVGKNGVSKRIDVFATALFNRMKLDEIASLDLSYAPPFAPVWDPVLVAVNVAKTKVK